MERQHSFLQMWHKTPNRGQALLRTTSIDSLPVVSYETKHATPLCEEANFFVQEILCLINE